MNIYTTQYEDIIVHDKLVRSRNKGKFSKSVRRIYVTWANDPTGFFWMRIYKNLGEWEAEVDFNGLSDKQFAKECNISMEELDALMDRAELALKKYRGIILE